jgi:hypothetical protein
MKNETRKLQIQELMEKLKDKFKFIKKYNYNIDEVVGVKGNERYILYTQKKLIRIYRGPLKSSPLLCSYIPIDKAIFYSFKIEKNVLEKLDLNSYIETKVYEEAGVEETQEYEIKYKIIDKLKDEKYVVIETVIVSTEDLNREFEYILEEAGYIDYLSFPAFSYTALYEEGILKKGNDLFVVLLYDKIFLTFYSEGELVYMNTLAEGLNKIYESLSELRIRGFSLELFKKLLLKKGLSIGKYSSQELIILEIIKKHFSNIGHLILEEINKFKEAYNIDSLDRVFITSEYGDIEEADGYLQHLLNLEVKSFEFYEKYNLDRLPVDPFLFLAMLETHYAYKYENQLYNFSKYLRKPTFFYRPVGILTLSVIGSIIVLGAYPLYLYLNGLSYENKNKELQKKINQLFMKKNQLQANLRKLHSIDDKLSKIIKENQQEIKRIQKFIEDVYKFKFSYLPKSQELVDITYFMNKNKVYAKNINYNNKLYIIKAFSYHESDIPNLIKDLSDNGFSVDFDEIVYKNGKYNSEIRIQE